MKPKLSDIKANKKSIYTEMYKDNEMHVFKDGSVDIVEHDICCADLTEAFKYIDKKEKMSYNQGVIVYKDPFSLAPCTPQVCNPVPCQTSCFTATIKGNNPMYVDNDKHIESSKINYLSGRADAVYYSKAESLPKLFGLGPYDSPETVQEFIDRIVTGKFTIKDPSKKDSRNFYYRPMEAISWKDPSVKEDQVGYDAALAALKVLFQDTKDTIAISTLADGLAAVKAMDAWTPTIATA